MDILFNFERLTNDLYASRMHASKYGFLMLPIVFVLSTIFSDDKFDIAIMALCVVFFGIGLFIHYKYKPLDKISLTRKALIINKFNEKTVEIKLSEIDSISSRTNLKIHLKSGKLITLSYGNWALPLPKVKELVAEMNKLL